MSEAHTIYRDRETGFTVSAWIAPDGSWRVRFMRRSSGVNHDKTATWLPSGRWDEHRWRPDAARLNPRTRIALAVAEDWLRKQPVPQEPTP